ncbi:hypothetical protein [Corynebacterium canis]|uniref:hypothetical protein n=1 Tax=Corynebacterium canis TaxID=679663 RepID=UPI0016465149|nr:hypothetical protein [Corynebacterium canis]
MIEIEIGFIYQSLAAAERWGVAAAERWGVAAAGPDGPGRGSRCASMRRRSTRTVPGRRESLEKLRNSPGKLQIRYGTDG